MAIKKPTFRPANRFWKSCSMQPPRRVSATRKSASATHLDIASVNSAMSIEHADGRIIKAYLAAGGIAPVPFYLAATSAYLQGKAITAATVLDAVDRPGRDSPISDIRGSADYKRLLLRQLIFAHFLKLFPDTIYWKQLHAR